MDINWDDPSQRWRTSCDEITAWYRVQSHTVENDRLTHKETKPLINQEPTSDEEAYWVELDHEDWGTWDVYFEDTFPQILRAAAITMLWARLETWTSYFCDYMMERRSLKATFRDMRKKDWILDQHFRYLRVIHGCPVDAGHDRIATLRQYYNLRCMIVHERADKSAISPLRDRGEVSFTADRVHIHDAAIQACRMALSEFTDYLMGVCADCLKSDRAKA